MIEIKEYFKIYNKEYWLEQMKASDWAAGKLLYELLREHKLKEACGEKTEVLMLMENGKLISYCTLAEKDDIQPTEITPWVGFVYTYPEYRGHHYAGKLLDFAEKTALNEGIEYLHISTGHVGLYEKYGYEFWKTLKDMNGEDSRVYRKKLLE